MKTVKFISIGLNPTPQMQTNASGIVCNGW
jgi:hypothetical protein